MIPHLVRNDFWVGEVGENASHFRTTVPLNSHSDCKEESHFAYLNNTSIVAKRYRAVINKFYLSIRVK